MDTETRKVHYKISINIGPLSYYQDSKVYEIPKGRSTVLPGLKYSLITLLLGWWGFGFKLKNPLIDFENSLKAIGTNFGGGIDVTKDISDFDYDEETNYIWNNLTRKTKDELSKNDVCIIIEICREFKLKKSESVNPRFIFDILEKLEMFHVDKVSLDDIFDAMQMYEYKNR